MLPQRGTNGVSHAQMACGRRRGGRLCGIERRRGGGLRRTAGAERDRRRGGDDARHVLRGSARLAPADDVHRHRWVAGVGSDAYVAVVTPAEQWVGQRPLQISLNEDGAALAEPRLVVDGDVKGGRYVSDLVDLVVGHELSAGGPWWR